VSAFRATGRHWLTLAAAAAVALSLAQIDWRSPLTNPGGAGSVGQFFSAVVRADLSGDFVLLVLSAVWKTLAFAIGGMTIAIAIGAPLGLLASGVLAGGRLSRLALILSGRASLAWLRAFHELVWALLLVTALGLSPVAGALAIGIPYGGILGLIYAALLREAPQAPLRSLERSGASGWQTLLYGRLPQSAPDLVSYTLYRFECAVRSGTVVSFIGLGGLGYQLQLSLDELLYGQVWTVLVAMVAVILLVEAWGSEVRRRLA
jgi:phosphonate transport system permease protein